MKYKQNTGTKQPSETLGKVIVYYARDKCHFPMLADKLVWNNTYSPIQKYAVLSKSQVSKIENVQGFSFNNIDKIISNLAR